MGSLVGLDFDEISPILIRLVFGSFWSPVFTFPEQMV